MSHCFKEAPMKHPFHIHMLKAVTFFFLSSTAGEHFAVLLGKKKLERSNISSQILKVLRDRKHYSKNHGLINAAFEQSAN